MQGGHAIQSGRTTCSRNHFTVGESRRMSTISACTLPCATAASGLLQCCMRSMPWSDDVRHLPWFAAHLL